MAMRNGQNPCGAIGDMVDQARFKNFKIYIDVIVL